MKSTRLIVPVALAIAALIAGVAAPGQQRGNVAHTNLKVGDMAPDFTLPDNNNKPVTLSSFRGKKNVILAFYVLAFTGGWTKELQGYQAGIDSGKIDLNDTAVFGVSIDASPSNNAFAKQLNLTFPLLSDMKREVSKAYGILNDQYSFANRTTFVVDKEGKINHIIEGGGAIDPTSAVEACTKLKESGTPK
jgi:peroxiredoxin